MWRRPYRAAGGGRSLCSEDHRHSFARYCSATELGLWGRLKLLNRAQVWKGWARVYVYDSNPFERVTKYRDAQAAAKAAPRGIWKVC